MKRAVELVESANKKSLSASDVSREIFMISLARLAFVYFGYRDKIELDKVVDFSPFKQMGIFSGESDSEITFTEDILQRAQYKPVEGARFAVEIVEKGVTNWNELRELLASSDEEIFKKGKQDEFDALVFGVLGNFSQVPDGFKERVISFIDENIAFLDVYHIELGGYFLKEIWGDSSFEKRWEEMWADANISRISKAKLREIMFHRSDVSEFLKERARAQYGAYVSKPKVSEAFLELFAGGAGEAHLDVLARLSASDCQAWLKEEHGQSLISETANFVASSFRGEGVHQKIASTIAKAVLSIEDDSVEGLFRVTQWKRTARRLSGDVGALESFLAGVINER
ncbi:MAG: hypothetical protein BGO12_13030 [Verrucomicrobia bacterium 61-8]|nr:MAG: hypothetical protein BGO12_13030 [Verrucomicrobia bacterium 61-8]